MQLFRAFSWVKFARNNLFKARFPRNALKIKYFQILKSEAKQDYRVQLKKIACFEKKFALLSVNAEFLPKTGQKTSKKSGEI
jgi:hypothetical protein